MSTKFVDVFTTSSELFVQKLLELGKLGAKLPEKQGVFTRGPLLRTRLEIDEDVVVPEHPTVKVIPNTNKSEKKEDKAEFSTDFKPAVQPRGRERAAEVVSKENKPKPAKKDEAKKEELVLPADGTLKPVEKQDKE